MNLIQQITSDAFQQQTLILDDGSTVLLQLYFMPMQYAWEITKLVYKTRTITGIRITNSPNILYQYQNLLPFGLACFSQANREPSQQQDFSSGASKLYILSATEVARYTSLIAAGSVV